MQAEIKRGEVSSLQVILFSLSEHLTDEKETESNEYLLLFKYLI